MLLERFGLEGRRGVVTGAGRALGVGMARGLAEAGAEVLLLARTESEIEQVADEICDAGGRTKSLALDILDEPRVQSVFRDLPALDILVNNAGTNPPQPFIEVDGAALETLLQWNIRAAFVVAQASISPRNSDAWR